MRYIGERHFDFASNEKKSEEMKEKRKKDRKSAVVSHRRGQVRVWEYDACDEQTKYLTNRQGPSLDVRMLMFVESRETGTFSQLDITSTRVKESRVSYRLARYTVELASGHTFERAKHVSLNFDTLSK